MTELRDLLETVDEGRDRHTFGLLAVIRAELAAGTLTDNGVPIVKQPPHGSYGVGRQ